MYASYPGWQIGLREVLLLILRKTLFMFKVKLIALNDKNALSSEIIANFTLKPIILDFQWHLIYFGILVTCINLMTPLYTSCHI